MAIRLSFADMSKFTT